MISVLTRVAMLTLFAVGLIEGPAAEDSGSVVNDLRLTVAIAESESGLKELEWKVENTSSNEEKFLVLGKVGYRYAELVKLVVAGPDGKRHYATYYGQRAGVGPSRQLPMIIPLLPRSTYAARTPLGGWGYQEAGVRKVEALLSEPGSMWLELEVGSKGVPAIMTDCSLDCFGMQIFWRGKLASNIIRFPHAASPASAKRGRAGRP